MKRHDGRGAGDMRPVSIVPDYLQQPLGSVLLKMGQTQVLCSASHEAKVPPFLQGQFTGWVTAEYSMLPASTNTRSTREASRGRLSGRTMEIQRLIGRALRTVVHRRSLGERTIWVDCDVLQADGGTRTASITGGFVALCLALDRLFQQGEIKKPPLRGLVSAISVGVVEGAAVLDLDYVEDSAAEVDMNIVRTDAGQYIELQGTAETRPFDRGKLDAMLELADAGTDALHRAQREALGGALDRILKKR